MPDLDGLEVCRRVRRSEPDWAHRYLILVAGTRRRSRRGGGLLGRRGQRHLHAGRGRGAAGSRRTSPARARAPRRSRALALPTCRRCSPASRTACCSPTLRAGSRWPTTLSVKSWAPRCAKWSRGRARTSWPSRPNTWNPRSLAAGAARGALGASCAARVRGGGDAGAARRALELPADRAARGLGTCRRLSQRQPGARGPAGARADGAGRPGDRPATAAAAPKTPSRASWPACDATAPS